MEGAVAEGAPPKTGVRETLSAAVTPTASVSGAPKPAAIVAIAIAGCLAGVLTIVLALSSDLDEPGVKAALIDWITLPYIAAGLVAWWRRPDSRLGVLMIAGGSAIFLSTLAWTSYAVPYTVGQLFDIVPAAIFLHVYLAFPSGRLRSRFERGLVLAGYVLAVGPQVVKMMLGYDSSQLLTVWSWPGAAQTVEDFQLLSFSALCITAIGVLAARRRHAGPPLRRSLSVLIDSFALGLVMIAVLFVAGALEWSSFTTIQRATFITIGLSPIAFLIALLDARLARSAVGDLMIELRSEPGSEDLRGALARALRDPSLTLAYWLPEFGSWTDLSGRPIELPTGNGGATTLIDREGVPVAALVHDRALNEEPELLAAVGAAAGIALENGRLHVELAARLDEVRGSRARVIEAGQKERQRLERNLHDGAQQRLIAVSLELRLLEKQLGGHPDAEKRLDDAQREIARSLAELRDVAHGIHPAVLTGHGLAVALEQVAARAPLPVRLTVDVEGRLAQRVEVAAYYVVTESLANVAKHARATAASVVVERTPEGVVVEVVDDGVGGADSERGSGLRGLADRVEALGGRLRVWTPQGGGTRVRAEIPCA
jgi:signal transduction histidine kinase